MKKLLLLAVLVLVFGCKKEKIEEEVPPPYVKSIDERIKDGEYPHWMLGEFTEAELMGHVFPANSWDTIWKVDDTATFTMSAPITTGVWTVWNYTVEIPETYTYWGSGEHNTRIIAGYTSNPYISIGPNAFREGYYIPSVDELKTLMNARVLAHDVYWTSSGAGQGFAYAVSRYTRQTLKLPVSEYHNKVYIKRYNKIKQ